MQNMFRAAGLVEWRVEVIFFRLGRKGLATAQYFAELSTTYSGELFGGTQVPCNKSIHEANQRRAHVGSATERSWSTHQSALDKRRKKESWETGTYTIFGNAMTMIWESMGCHQARSPCVEVGIFGTFPRFLLMTWGDESSGGEYDSRTTATTGHTHTHTHRRHTNTTRKIHFFPIFSKNKGQRTVVMKCIFFLM